MKNNLLKQLVLQLWLDEDEPGKLDLLKLYIANNYEQYSGLLLEKYFRQKFAEEETITAIGNFWDNNALKQRHAAIYTIIKTAELSSGRFYRFN